MTRLSTESRNTVRRFLTEDTLRYCVFRKLSKYGVGDAARISLGKI